MEVTNSSLLYSRVLFSVSRRSGPPFTHLPSSSNVNRRFLCSVVRSSARYAILGAGFAGLSVAWHLLQHSSKESGMSIDIYDESGLGGGASGISGGLLHPYSPKGKLLWRGSESWGECLKLLAAAERALELSYSSKLGHDQSCSLDGPIILRRGILRPGTNETNVEILKANAQNCLTSCPLDLLAGQAATSLVPNLSVPFNFAVFMPLAMNIHPKRYLKALFMACKNFANEVSSTAQAMTEISLFKKHVERLHELDGEYDAVVICLGAKAEMLPELSGNLPLRNCRGIIAELELPADVGEYSDQSPSILSDAWLAFQGPQNLLMGSTWDWSSNNYSSLVSSSEAAEAMKELLPKVSVVYPNIKKWEFVRARAGLRAMPPLTPFGSLPLLGSVGEAVGRKGGNCRCWLVGGLGSRGLLHHGLMGKLIAGAVVSSNEGVIPSELTSWKRKETCGI
ncbi:uncharacterized protein LOC110029269 [Phalaenopsis equestris]|uniref:uncharacterized protein LOC110029269 n=1 Tax=Phalaenopsis equestris TaxID=78828 RepID=UPI0009E4CCC2|nr:uncharacterized protein LOC110029269 [Phalaenopsis equestris]